MTLSGFVSQLLQLAIALVLAGEWLRKRATPDDVAANAYIPGVLTAAGVWRGAPPATQAACRTDQGTIVTTSPWFRVPYPGQWGSPTFSWGSSLIMLAGALSAMVESARGLQGVGWVARVAMDGCLCPTPAHTTANDNPHQPSNLTSRLQNVVTVGRLLRGRPHRGRPRAAASGHFTRRPAARTVLRPDRPVWHGQWHHGVQ